MAGQLQVVSLAQLTSLFPMYKMGPRASHGRRDVNGPCNDIRLACVQRNWIADGDIRGRPDQRQTITQASRQPWWIDPSDDWGDFWTYPAVHPVSGHGKIAKWAATCDVLKGFGYVDDWCQDNKAPTAFYAARKVSIGLEMCTVLCKYQTMRLQK